MGSRGAARAAVTGLAACLVGLAVGVAAAAPAVAARGKERVLRVAYFIPADRAAAPRHAQRLRRVLEDIRAFYAGEMEANGHGPLTFDLDLDRGPGGGLRIIEVQGHEPAAAYGRDDQDKVRAEVARELARRGIDMDDETVLVFQRLMDWQDGRNIETGPYRGGGSGGVGVAYVYDDAHLDAALLPSTEDGGYCVNRPCSWGAFNSLYIGGIAHELGHAFGLPHLAETAYQREEYGLSLMAAGSRTYRATLRGDGPASFLAPASALALAGNPLFAGGSAAATGDGDFRLTDLDFAAGRGRLTITGRVVGGTPALGVIARNDDEAVPGDYDAVGWSAKVGPDGRFKIVVGDLEAGRYSLTLTIAGEDGRFRSTRLGYSVDDSGTPDIAPLRQGDLLAEADKAFAAGDRAALRRAVAALRRAEGPAQEDLAKAAHLLALLTPKEPVAPADIPARRRTAEVSALAFTDARTGYGPALRDQVRLEGGRPARIEVGGEFFPSGLYAHAPAQYRIATGGAWDTLRTGYGLQDGHGGSVVFVVRGDGRELFRSPVVRDHAPRRVSVDIAGVAVVDLLTEDGGDGRSADWGVWLTPTLGR